MDSKSCDKKKENPRKIRQKDPTEPIVTFCGDFRGLKIIRLKVDCLGGGIQFDFG
jgi:hypothetical protein